MLESRPLLLDTYPNVEILTPSSLTGSFPGTIIFFGVYEYSKRHMIDAGVNPSLSYLAGGMSGVVSCRALYSL